MEAVCSAANGTNCNHPDPEHGCPPLAAQWAQARDQYWQQKKSMGSVPATALNRGYLAKIAGLRDELAYQYDFSPSDVQWEDIQRACQGSGLGQRLSRRELAQLGYNRKPRFFAERAKNYLETPKWADWVPLSADRYLPPEMSAFLVFFGCLGVLIGLIIAWKRFKSPHLHVIVHPLEQAGDADRGDSRRAEPGWYLANLQDLTEPAA